MRLVALSLTLLLTHRLRLRRSLHEGWAESDIKASHTGKW
jgi:hypothetical protein